MENKLTTTTAMGSQQPHILYVVTLSGSTGEVFSKIGITKYTPEIRFKNEDNYKLIESVSYTLTNGIQARGLESILKETVILPNKIQYGPKLRLNGYSECFKFDYFDSILHTINTLISINNMNCLSKTYKNIYTNEIQVCDYFNYNLEDYKEIIKEEKKYDEQLRSCSNYDDIILEYEDDTALDYRLSLEYYQ